MSKSKGNILDPIDLIDGIDLETLVSQRTSNMMQPDQATKIERSTRKQFPDGIPAFGTDALRYTFYSLASTGRDINFDMGRIEGYRNFCNKIWNAARYVFMNTEEETVTRPSNNDDFSRADIWIRSRLQDTLKKVDEAVATYRFDLVSQAIYDFFWNEYCDWYLELSKPALWDESATTEQKNATRFTLLDILEQSLRMVHPLMPFITEEIWQKAAPQLGIEGDTVMLQPYPEIDEGSIDANVDKEIEWLKGVIVAIRNIRGELNISPATKIKVLLTRGCEQDKQLLGSNSQFLITLAKLESVTWLEDPEAAPLASMQVIGEMDVLVPMAGLIDISAELDRLGKEQDKLKKEIGRLSGKLGNAKFVDNAPNEVVAKEREKLSNAETTLIQLQDQMQKLKQAGDE